MQYFRSNALQVLLVVLGIALGVAVMIAIDIAIVSSEKSFTYSVRLIKLSLALAKSKYLSLLN